MPDSKVSALTAVSSVDGDELLYIVDDPGGTPLARKVTVANLLAADPLGIGFPTTVWPVVAAGSSAFANANDAEIMRAQGKGSVSNLAVNVGVSSGNISLAAYANSGSGRSAQPTGTRLGTTGAVACPATGFAEVSLGGTVAVPHGSWLGLSADNTTATFQRAHAAAASSGSANGSSYRHASAHPLPASLTALVAASRHYLVLGT